VSVGLGSSTFSNNAASGGGALYVDSSPTTLRSCTLHANTGGGIGDAIAMMGKVLRGESLTLTLTGTASRQLVQTMSGASIVLVNSVVADCTWPCFSASSSAKINVTSSLLPGVWSGAGGNNTVSTDARLGPLADYGGPTWTRAPLPGSPVIGAGNSALLDASATTDQRGLPRITGTAVDLGAVECECRLPHGCGGMRDHNCWRPSVLHVWQ
jgi:hypothetical protein